MKGNPKQSWLLDSGLQFFFPVFVNGTWIPDSNRQWDSGFLELNYGFQNPESRIPQAKFSGFRNHDCFIWGDILLAVYNCALLCVTFFLKVFKAVPDIFQRGHHLGTDR